MVEIDRALGYDQLYPSNYKWAYCRVYEEVAQPISVLKPGMGMA
jgi:hypothetical protein